MDEQVNIVMDHLSYIETFDGRVLDVSDAFLYLSEYRKEDFCGKSTDEITKLLRLCKDLNCLSMEEPEESCFMFTKSLEPVEVRIRAQQDPSSEKKTFVFREAQWGRILSKFPYVTQISTENFMGVAIYSIPDFILLTSNEYYLGFLKESPGKVEKCVGRRISEILPGWAGSSTEKIWKDIILQNKSFHTKEYRFDHPERGETYWDCSITPISEAGEIKYIIMTSNDVTEYVLQRNQLEEQTKIVKKQKEQLEAIIGTVSDELGIVDGTGRYITLNKAAITYFPSDICTSEIDASYSLARYFDAAGRELAQEELPIRRVLQGEVISRFKLAMKLGSQEYHFSVNARPIFDETGRFVIGIISSRDISDTVRQNRIIMEQNKQLEATFEHMSDALFIMDRYGKYTRLNKAARENYFSPSQFILEAGDGLKYAEYYDSCGNRVPLEETLPRRVLHGEKITGLRMEIKFHDNRSMDIDVSGTPIYDSSGNFIMGIICSRDITDKVKKEKVIEKQRDYLFGIIDTFNLPIIRLTYPDFKVTEMNRKALEYLNSLDCIHVPRKEKIQCGVFMEEIFPKFDGNENYALIRQMVQTKSTVQIGDCEFFHNGRKWYLKVIYQPVLNARGDVSEFLITGVDITAEIDQRDELKNIIKMKDEFIATVSHEFKTPLAVINAAVQALEVLCKNELSDKAKGFIQSIHQNSFRQMRLVNNLLDLTILNSGALRIQRKNMDIVFATRVIVESVQPYARQKGVHLRFSSLLPSQRVILDDEKYERILLNLLSNAIKFTPKGKSILVMVSKENDTIVIKVKDKGVGIPVEKQELIFERFGQVDSSLTRQNEGTGIGLSLVKSLTGALGGSIILSSQEGKGSIFTLMFPIAAAAPVEPELDMCEFADNHLTHSTAIEFSDIYFE